MGFYNPTQKVWRSEPYMIKEHTVFEDGYAATVVIVPLAKKNSDDKDAITFMPLGVRIEHIGTRKVWNELDRSYQLPGQSWFFKNNTEMLSYTSEWRFNTPCGCRPFFTGNRPEVRKPSTKFAGVALEDFPMGARFGKLIEHAKISYQLWVEAKRAA